ncbi:hypothetical protein L5515_003726 [Caenorhabditis briggsae]|uniref:Uncharacterized protein n=1 Tax=Caenorhabditis briggsae TaxID=6238 RepID=A0AAE9EFI4_CAEBR|nr:hypothetical protein L5515_003726 [Caenorhabditis briggsae]
MQVSAGPTGRKCPCAFKLLAETCILIRENFEAESARQEEGSSAVNCQDLDSQDSVDVDDNKKRPVFSPDDAEDSELSEILDSSEEY